MAKTMKTTPKTSNHGDKNTKLNGYQAKTNTISKYQQTV